MKDFYSSYFPHKQASYLPDADFAAFLPISLSFPPCLFFSALFSFPSVLRSSSATLLGPARCVPESCSSARAGDEINPCKTPQGPNRASFLASATFEGGGGIFRVGDPLASRPDPPPPRLVQKLRGSEAEGSAKITPRKSDRQNHAPPRSLSVNN